MLKVWPTKRPQFGSRTIRVCNDEKICELGFYLLTVLTMCDSIFLWSFEKVNFLGKGALKSLDFKFHVVSPINIVENPDTVTTI